VLPVVPTVRIWAARAAPVTTSMWHRRGCKGAPENDLEVSAAAAGIMRHCFNDSGYRGPLPTRYRG